MCHSKTPFIYACLTVGGHVRDDNIPALCEPNDETIDARHLSEESGQWLSDTVRRKVLCQLDITTF